MSRADRNEIRCICARSPLLATYDRDARGKYFLHVKVYKQQRIYGEVWVEADALVKLRCRECLRIQKVRMVSNRPTLEEVHEPKGAPEDRSSTARVDPNLPPT